MISVPSLNIKGQTGEKVKLSEAVFGVDIDPRTSAQAVRVYLSNQRKANAKTKSRGEVAKTTAKMYRQKGTGRARHGSYSAPVFVGGGIAHGPDGRQNYKKTLPKKITRATLLASLSDKVKADMVIVTGLNNIDRTKAAKTLTEKILGEENKLLLVLSSEQKITRRAFRNLKNTSVVYPNQISTYNIIKHNKMAIANEALEEINKLFTK